MDNIPAGALVGERRAGDAAHIAQLLEQRGRIRLRVRGTSMLPWVRPGDVVLIRRAGISDVRCGDVVLFKRHDRLVVHRLVEKRGSLNAAEFSAKGDAHPTGDGIVEQQEMLGRVVRLYRGHKAIDMDAPPQLALGLLVSQLSRKSAYWYPVAKAAALVTLPLRRVWQAVRAA